MAKSKRGPALIEVIRKGETATDSGSMSLPSWWRSARRSSQPPAARESRRDLEHAPAAEGAQRVAEFREPIDEPPLMQVLGQRVVVSLSSVGAGLSVFLFLLLLGGAYLVGRDQGSTRGRKEGFERGREFFQARAQDEIQAAREAAPTTGLFAGLGSSPVAVAGTDSEAGGASPAANRGAAEGGDDGGRSAVQWVKGHTYIVVQEFRTEDADDAHAAQMFLQNQGIATVVLESATSTAYKYRLVTPKGFNREDPAQRRLCDEYHQRIRDCGKLFVKAGGRYELQGYQKKLTGNGW